VFVNVNEKERDEKVKNLAHLLSSASHSSVSYPNITGFAGFASLKKARENPWERRGVGKWGGIFLGS